MISIRQNYEENISFLEKNLKSTEKKLEEVIKNSSKELGVKCVEIDKSLENQAGAFKIVKNLEEEILNLQKKTTRLEKTRLKLERNVKEKEEFLQNIKQKNVEYRDKVKEAIQLVSAALNEKDAALFREKEANGELCTYAI
ncbi:hypothetical protein NQ314_020457 [Rhamnusium bicolor]|uniref:Uncharacterized protein n=1 Tax=Rhamnusium bicolor TaxID=1586634 RepID=A0AAV8WL42_9CUCU|nr:hypothetical protein NQ314_020457 [Rhamnusium bicolor]